MNDVAARGGDQVADDCGFDVNLRLQEYRLNRSASSAQRFCRSAASGARVNLQVTHDQHAPLVGLQRLVRGLIGSPSVFEPSGIDASPPKRRQRSTFAGTGEMAGLTLGQWVSPLSVPPLACRNLRSTCLPTTKRNRPSSRTSPDLSQVAIVRPPRREP